MFPAIDRRSGRSRYTSATRSSSITATRCSPMSTEISSSRFAAGKRCTARRLAAPLRAAALAAGATPVGRPLGPLAPLRLIPRGLLRRPPGCRRSGFSESSSPSPAHRRQPAAYGPDRRDYRAAACSSAPPLRRLSRSAAAGVPPARPPAQPGRQELLSLRSRARSARSSCSSIETRAKSCLSSL